jgi:hypothetical protein
VTSSGFVLGRAQNAALPSQKAVPVPVAPGKRQGEPTKAAPVLPQGKVDVKPAAKAKAAMKGVAVKARVGEQQAAAVLDAQAAQYVQQFWSVFRSEYAFLRSTCNLNSEQRKEVARLGERAVKAAARQYLEAQRKFMHGGVRPGTEYLDPHKLIEQELTRAVAPLLSHDQERLYHLEIERRTASHKQVVIDNMIVKLDGDLVLTLDQRTKLVEALHENWQDSWFQVLEMLMDIDSFLPNVPDRVITPFLSDPQKEVWRRIPKSTNAFWGFRFGNGMNEPLEDPELDEAQKDAGARNIN